MRSIIFSICTACCVFCDIHYIHRWSFHGHSLLRDACSLELWRRISRSNPRHCKEMIFESPETWHVDIQWPLLWYRMFWKWSNKFYHEGHLPLDERQNVLSSVSCLGVSRNKSDTRIECSYLLISPWMNPNVSLDVDRSDLFLVSFSWISKDVKVSQAVEAFRQNSNYDVWF